MGRRGLMTSSTKAHLNSLCNVAKKMGAVDARLIRAGDVVVRNWVRLKCQFGCGGYGRSLTCPPYTPTPYEFRKILKEYRWAILLKFDGRREESEVHDHMIRIEREAFLGGYYAAFGLAAGPCPRCEECDLEKCKYPDLVRPSMESCGIDVFATVRKVGFDLRVVKSEDEIPSYYGLLLVE